MMLIDLIGFWLTVVIGDRVNPGHVLNFDIYLVFSLNLKSALLLFGLYICLLFSLKKMRVAQFVLRRLILIETTLKVLAECSCE
jgi:hypothetical protein